MKPTANEWALLFELLDTAFELPSAERVDWLRGMPEDQALTRQRLEQLLDQQARLETSDFLATPVVLGGLTAAGVQAAFTGSAAFEAGARIGTYRLIREIGAGGMGKVWLAQRTDGHLDRQVALKLPFAGPHQREFLRSFERERDILAALTHPNIARLYDAGVSDTGQPYLAMEYVDGITLIDYCRDNGLSLRQRLELFCQVLRAVRYAHANLVIHRDLKPTNILVTAAGDIQLLDFGIAKLMVAGEAGETALTKMVGRALTPDYASPEQILGAPLSIASDTYSLGVLLYEMLVGERPYRLQRHSAAALEEAILTADPVRPSALARDARSRRGLAGDLDTIVLKALKKEPGDRYATADAFLQDVERHLKGQPVLARPDGLAYRARKFVARNRVAVGAASLAALVLIGASLLFFQQAQFARAQARVAWSEAQRAQAVQGFLLDIFKANTHLQKDPVKARQTTVRDMLDIGARQVGDSLRNVPDAQAEVLITLGDMYTQMGLDAQASELRLQRIDALKRAYGPRDPRIAEALVDYVEDIAYSRDRAKSLPALQEAQGILDDAHDFASEARADLDLEYGRYFKYTEPEKMQIYADSAVRILEQGAYDTWSYPLALAFAAQARFELGKYEESELLYRRSLAAVHRRDPGPSAWDIAPLAQMAGTQAALLDIVEAERNFRSSLAVTEKLNGAGHIETLQSGSRLGAFLCATSRLQEGRRLLETAAHVVQDDASKRGDAVVATVNGFYGQCLLQEGEIEGAEPYLAQDVQDARTMYPGSMPLARGLLLQGELLIDRGKFDEAQRNVDEATDIRHRVGGNAKDAALEVPYRNQQARLALLRGDTRLAVELIGAERDPADAARLPLMPDAVAAKIILVQAYERQQRLGDALDAARSALGAVQRSEVRAFFQPLEADAELAVGQVLRRLGQSASALAHLRHAVSLREAVLVADSPWLAQADIELANDLLDQNTRGEARRLSTRAAAIEIAHPALGEQWRAPLRELMARLAVRSVAQTPQ